MQTESFDLSSLSKLTLDSEFQPGVRYRMDRAIGEGGMGMVFLALRDAPEGVAPVVVKVVRPWVVGSALGAAGKMVRKEVVALGRLNERIPQTPFVVRFIDTGDVKLPGTDVALPWIAVEYVYGGIEGTTLEQRVEYSCRNVGYGFEPTRAAHALRCLGAGVAAIHEVGVVHRDITPGNVLCCGFGEAEIFKVSDFGLARMQSLETFGDVVLGTPGYAPPEQNFPENHGVAPYSDVFSLACVTYFLLTGEPYFDALNAAQALVAAAAPARKSVQSSRWLCPELRADARACDEIDRILAGATTKDVFQRPQHAQELTGALIGALGKATQRDGARASRRLVQSILNLPSPVEVRGWTWTLRHPPGDDVALHGVAWESDGHCLAATTQGLSYWNGTAWVRAPMGSLGSAVRPRCVHRASVGTWVLGGHEVIATYGTGGVQELIACPGASLQHVCGNVDDLLVAVSDGSASGPELLTLSGRRWHAPMPLDDFAVVSALARFGAAVFLIAGRRRDGTGGLSLCRPLERRLVPIALPPSRAVVQCVSQPERELGLAVGTEGLAVSVHPGGITTSTLDGQPALSACAVDILDREWAASGGRLWVKEPGAVSRWRPVWEDSSFVAPFVSLIADVDVLLAITADGGVLEGRAPWSVIAATPVLG